MTTKTEEAEVKAFIEDLISRGYTQYRMTQEVVVGFGYTYEAARYRVRKYQRKKT